MSAKKFKFVSPGVFVDEIDNSQLPEAPEGVGPVVIGRTARGPAMVPVQVNSFSDFVETFGNPVFGGGVPDASGFGLYRAPLDQRGQFACLQSRPGMANQRDGHE